MEARDNVNDIDFFTISSSQYTTHATGRDIVLCVKLCLYLIKKEQESLLYASFSVYTYFMPGFRQWVVGEKMCLQ